MKINCYFHGGSGNHGCEAIVRSTGQLINSNANLFSFNLKEDRLYQVDKVMKLYRIGKIKKWYPSRIFFYLVKKITHSNENFILYKYRVIFKHSSDIALLVGGDNYCYEKGTTLELIGINSELNKRRVRTILWSCSVEPNLLQDPEIIEDMKKYSHISARESITYNALLKAGIKNVSLIPDVAFTLKKEEVELPEGFVQGNTIGINVSPLIIQNESVVGATMRNFEMLIQHIIDTTDMQIALIPHVVWKSNDDRKPLRELYERFKDSRRLVMIEDHNCMELKGYISKCRMFVGARTHATIAAYSSCVPTLVIGYSVKAKGIAQDIFGTYENHVIPVQSLGKSDNIVRSFEWLKDNESSIKEHLQKIMPNYIEKVFEAKNIVNGFGDNI